MALAVLPLLALLVLIGPAAADERGFVLPESGIRYPDGFDINTVGVIRGKASDVQIPESGPVRFRVASGRDTYTVLASPPWYWNDLNGNGVDGMTVQVRGSKTLGRDGNLYLIAQEVLILPTNRVIVFRGEDGSPFWRASGLNGERKGGFGSPMRGEGAGRGMGTGGRGRR
ncbi:MAG: hypothetical protein A4E73_01914 [Syntrophaceae bacterium PtaU1.Bin231]|nr:MAG: hypothetical protein A4E73_01914 [Syntrophaceae bacterium PtaU1.Bin231]